MTHFTAPSPLRAPALPRSFSAWRSAVDAAGALPIVAVAGSRGKSTVIRIVDAIYRRAGLRSALWTDQGIEADGRRQPGELVPWSRALERLRAGDLDVAIQELDWATVSAVGLPPDTYPVVAVTNLCLNSGACLAAADTERSLIALETVRAATRTDGATVLNGEDFAVAGAHDRAPATVILAALSPDAPLIRAHRGQGGAAAWTQDDRFEFGEGTKVVGLGPTDRFSLGLGGSVGFQLHNALVAAAIARACGVPSSVIEPALSDLDLPPTRLPGSFNFLTYKEATVILERPVPSWFLRPSVRAVAHLRSGRVLTVAGSFPNVPVDDLYDIGRLLGRSGGAFILHDSDPAVDRAVRLRAGIASNDVPPMVIHLRDERSATRRALSMLRPDDLLFVVTEQPTKVLRMLDR